jgi:aryl-alcohol dehydrogenase-like predicted oxidoreductase
VTNYIYISKERFSAIKDKFGAPQKGELLISSKLYSREADFEVADTIIELSKEKNISGAEIVLAWLHQNPIVASPIFGATQLQHIEEAVHSLEVSLSPEEIEKVQAPYQVNKVMPWNL